MKRSLITLTIVSIFLALYLIGCGGGDGVSTITPSVNTNDGTGSLSFTVPWPESGADLTAQLIQSNVKKIRIELLTTSYAPLSPAKLVEIDYPTTTGSLTAITPGDYLVDCQGKDVSGNTVSRRVRKVTVKAGTNDTVVAILGISIINGAFSPTTIALSPGDQLFWGNEDFGKNKTYWVRFIINGKVTNVGPLTEGSLDPNTCSHTFLDSELTQGGNVSMELYEGTSSGPAGSVINQGNLQVGSPTGNSYSYKGRWGELSLNGYDANNGWGFVTADETGHFYAGFYNPVDVFYDLTTTVPRLNRNLIEQYDADGKHVRSVKYYTDGIIQQILGMEVDRDGRYLYVACYTPTDVPAVLRYDAQSGGTPVSLGYTGTFGDNVAGTHGMADDIQGVCIGYDAAQKTPKFLYVVDGAMDVEVTYTVPAATVTYYGTIHRADISTNSATPLWDGDTGWTFTAPNSATITYPVGYNSTNAGVSTFLIGASDNVAFPVLGARPTEIAITNDSKVLYLIDDFAHNVNTNMIKRYDAISGSDTNHSDLQFSPNRLLSGIATNTAASVQGSVGTGSAVFVITADTAVLRGNDVYKYNGSGWLNWGMDKFTRPLADDVVSEADQSYVPYLYGLNFANANTVDGYTSYLDSNGSAVIDNPPEPSCDGTVMNVGTNGPIGTDGNYGDLPTSFPNLSITVVPNSDDYLVTADYFHHIAKWQDVNNLAVLFDDWRMPQDSFAICFDVDKDKAGNIYMTDAGNCRVLKFDTAYQYLGQWGFPVYYGTGASVQESRDLGDTVTNLATNFEFNAPLGLGIDLTNGYIYVVDRDRSDLDAWFVNNGSGLVGTGLRGRVQQFGANAGTKGNGPIIATSNVAWHGSSAKQFCYPTGMAVDAEGDLYIADTGDGPNPGEGVGNGTGLLEDVVQKMTNTGQGRFQFTGSPEVSTGSYPPNLVKDVIVDDTNNMVFVSDRWQRVMKYNKTSPLCIGWMGTTGTAGGSNQDGEFNIPAGLALDKDKYVYVVDVRNARVQKFPPKGNGYVTNWDSGQLRHPWGVVVTEPTTGGNVFVTDRVHNRVVEYAPVLQ